MPKAVSDASPLIHLAAIGQFSLLPVLFDEVLIPPTVWREVVQQGRGRPGAAELELARSEGWLRVVPLETDLLARTLKRDLDEGEAEAIGLALQQKTDIVLLDESEARKAAEALSLAKTGVVGLLLRAKREKKVDSLRANLDRLRDQAGFWIDQALYLTVLRAPGEA